MANILIVDDELAIRELLGFVCETEGHSVTKCSSVEEARKLLSSSEFDLILLDWMLPGESGVSWLRELKSSFLQHIPVILLTARGEESARVEGLDSGADDYIVKPFLPKELSARIRLALRRKSAPMQKKDEPISLSGITVNPATYEVFVDDIRVSLPLREFKVLQLLIENPGRVYSREELLKRVWNTEYLEDRTIDVHILRIRRALGDKAQALETVRGVGYRFNRQS